MTIAVLAATTTTTKRREPLGTIGMAAPQAQSRPAPASGRAGSGRGGRRSTRLGATEQGLEEIPHQDGKRKASECCPAGDETNAWTECCTNPLSTPTDYEEDAEGFQFSRVPSKKARPSVEPVSEVSHSDVENAPPKSTPRRGRPPKKRVGEDSSAGAVPVKGKMTELPTRKPMRGAAKAANAEPESPTGHTMRSSRNRALVDDQSEEKKRKRGRPGKPRTSESNGFKSPEQPPAGTKVALPMADTPVIQRNKELRGAKSDKGRRRSSLGMRGRRASSLIDSGTSNGKHFTSPLETSW